MAGAAPQRDQQLVDAAVGINCIIVFIAIGQGIKALHGLKVDLQFFLCITAGLAGQYADHLVQVGVLFVGVYHLGSDFVAVFVGGGLVFIGHIQPRR